jgi:flagellin-like hook-associated protein FlgL
MTILVLASGLRINKTADDSAGSNVSIRMNNQVRGMAQANRNTQDTNNLLATAESGLSDISNILSKMRELSVQASTDTLNDVDRASINLEFQALKDELTRISNATEYNNMNVLNGSYQSNNGRGQWRIQIGADNDANNQHQVSVMDSTATGLGLRSEVKVTDLPSLVDAINNNEVEIYIDKTTGNFTEPSNSNAVKLESDGTSLYVVGMKTTTLSSAIDTSNNGGNIVVTDPTGFDSGGGTVVISGITTTTTSRLMGSPSGTGTFIDSGQSLGSSISLGASLGDMDNDGDLDAFVANQGANKVWINDGNGNFTDSGQSLAETLHSHGGVALGDVDGDNDLDAFVGNDHSNGSKAANKV